LSTTEQLATISVNSNSARRTLISSSPEAPRPPPSRDRSISARRKARQTKADRERRIVSLLNAGVSVAEIANRQRVSLKRMRNLVGEILAKRAPQPPAEYLALQVSRLNEALLVSYTAMHGALSGTNFEAVDRVIKIIRELDRYHGFAFRDGASRPGHPQLAPSAQAPLALGPPTAEPLGDSGMAPQAVEIAQNGLGNGAALSAEPSARGECENASPRP
jgi:DNA-binding CsgD family transcriptional regulator